MNPDASSEAGTLHEMVRFDWSDPDELLVRADTLLDEVTRNGSRLLHSLLQRLPDRTDLHELCERLDFMDKLVLWEDPELDVRLRLHVFRPGYVDWPHNHRFNFASRILSGSYLHNLYSELSLTSPLDSPEWVPRLSRVETAGSQYVLQHQAVHSLKAVEKVISVVFRGPIVKSRAVIVDRRTGTRHALTGARGEQRRLRESKQMSRAVLDSVIAEVRNSVDHQRDLQSSVRSES
jgi:hypothetical protein